MRAILLCPLVLSVALVLFPGPDSPLRLGAAEAGVGMAVRNCPPAVEADPLPSPQEPEKKEPPKTVKVSPDSLVVVEKITGHVGSRVNHPLRIKMDQWTDLEVREVLPQGSLVRDGDVLLQLDTEEFDQKIAEAKLDMQLAELDMNLAQAEKDYADRTWELDRELAESTWNQTRDDAQFWLNVRKNLEIESTQRSLKNSEFGVEYAQEELTQLEKMYSEDELTEESEKIVLERTKRDLDNSKFYLKRSQIETDRELNIDIPRSEENQKRTLRRGELEYNKKMIDLPAEKEKRGIEFAKKQLTFRKSSEEFEKLTADYGQMVIRAPASGVLYHGEFNRGKWTNGSGSKLREIRGKDKLGNDSIVLTLVDPEQLELRCDLTEAQAALIQPGMKAHVTAVSLPGKRFLATVESVSLFPVEGENHDCQLKLEGAVEGLRPGTACELKVAVYSQPAALLVPTASVFSDDGEISHFVFVLKDGKPVRTEVQTGRTRDDKTEITAGLSAGDEILESRPARE